MNFKREFRQRLTVTLSTLALLSLTGTAQAKPTKALTASQIIDRVQATYETTNDYTASFVQTTAHKLFPGKYQRAYGEVFFKKGGLMRWMYKRPSTKLFIYDGTLLWVYEPDVPQIFKGSDQTERLKKALAFLTGKGKIKSTYKVKMGKSRRDFTNGYVVYLTPKNRKSPFARVEIYINKTNFMVERSIVVDHDKNRNRIDFHGARTNTGLDPQMFVFTPPAGVPIISARP